MNLAKSWKFQQVCFRILCIVAFGLQLGAVPLGKAAAQQNPADLARIEVNDEAALNELAALGLSFYAQMGAASGGWIVAAAVDAAQQAELARRGTVFTIVDREIPADGKGYYLLYATPEDLTAVGKVLPLLVVEDRQALARLSEAQAAEAEALGAATLPVTPFQLAPVQPQTAAARTLAPDLVYSPAVQSMVNAVQQSTLVDYESKLSGEVAAVIGGSPFVLSTRSTMAEQSINKATRLGYEHFQGLGLPVDYDYFYFWGLQRRNVIAEQPGITQPGRIYLLSAHLDSTSNDYLNLAPGADDNASGSAAVMAIADILSQYHFACTLRYALYTGEEQGLYGSIDYANDVVARGDNVQGVLNLDMLGYNSWGTSPTFDLHTRPGNAGDLAIAYLFRDAVNTYLPSGTLIPLIKQDNLRFSDHAPFWDRGFPALLAIEDWNDHTPHYHDTSDQLENLNIPYYTAFVKGALAAFAHMGCLLDDGLAGKVTRASGGSALMNAQVSAWLTGQNPHITMTNPQGNYYLDLADGTYTVKFSAPDYQSQTVTNVHVASGQAASLNRALQPCSTVKDPTFTPSLILPNPGQQVTFQAAVISGQAPVTYSWNFGDGSSASGSQAAHTFSAAGVYRVKVTANNVCDYPLEYTRYLFVGIDPVTLPFLAR